MALLRPTSHRLRCFLDGQRFNELIEKDRYSVSRAISGRLGLRPARHHGSTLIDQDRAVRLDELMEHRLLYFQRPRDVCTMGHTGDCTNAGRAIVARRRGRAAGETPVIHP